MSQVNKWFVFEEDGEPEILAIAPNSEALVLPLGTFEGLKAQLAEARALLKEIETVPMDPDSSYNDNRCLFCDGNFMEGKRPQGHAPDCRLDKAIRGGT